MTALRKLRVVETGERVLPSPSFIRITRNPALRSPVRFEPTTKRPEDVVI
jgi:hypothetical protein